ncbi:MAG TPA: SDR family NAD(P)-dependent oxidoreductase [Opitutaceae bacterium]|nr:SDR family NAD(P)-dependent oxidoreductase [Opitutaceae bacterium]
MKTQIDKKRFGPWALITGASSGIGREFARRIAASGINIVLVARREALIKEAGAEFSKDYGVEHRVVALDLAEDGFMGKLASVTDDLDIGLVVSNAGTGNPGDFLKLDRQLLQATLRLNTMSHFRHRPLLRPEARRAEAGRDRPRGGNGCGKWRAPHGE